MQRTGSTRKRPWACLTVSAMAVPAVSVIGEYGTGSVLPRTRSGRRLHSTSNPINVQVGPFVGQGEGGLEANPRRITIRPQPIAATRVLRAREPLHGPQSEVRRSWLLAPRDEP